MSVVKRRSIKRYGFSLPIRRLLAYGREFHNHQQLCKNCGRAQSEVDFVVSDREWRAIVPAHFNKSALCITCFEVFAVKCGRSVVKIFLVNGP